MLRLLSWICERLPERWLQRVGRLLGWVALSVLRIRRGVALENIDRALGLRATEGLRVARGAYGHLCVGALEFLRLGALTPARAERILGAEGLTRLRRILAEQRRGVLVLSAHLGQWDLLACAAGRCGIKVHVVTREIKATWLNRFWMARRRACGVELLGARGSARAILEALRRNEVVALVLDQHEPGGIVVPFFGRPAATSPALARLARASGSPVVPVFLVREDGAYRLKVLEPLVLRRSTDRRSDLVENTRLFNEVLEEQIRRHPEQWLWVHRRWKAADAHRPTSTPA